MNKINRIFAVVALLLVFGMAEAQMVSPVDFMRMNPYQMKANPAADLPYKSVMSFVVGNVGLDVQNSALRYENLFEFDAQGRPVTMNLKKFANSLGESNSLGVKFDMELVTLFRRLKKGMMTFDYGIKVQTDMKYNDGLFQLLANGNSAFVGEDNPVKVNLDLNAQAYQEFALGYQLNVTSNLSVGGRAKLLFGYADVFTDVIEAKLFTDPNSYALRLQENVGVRASLPDLLCLNEGKLMVNKPFRMTDLFRNPGFGLDLAAEYRFNDKFSAVAAVRDLGFISWGGNNLKMTSEINDAGQFYDNGSFLFEGLDWEQLQLISSDESYRAQFLDSLKQYFNLQFDPMERYTTALNTNLMLRGNYNLDASNRISAQVQGQFLGTGFRPALTLAYSGSFLKVLDVCATYTIMPHSYDNIGIGLAGNFGIFHVYATTNNVIGLLGPMGASGMNARFGIVFNLWMPEKRFVDESDKPEYLE